MRCPNCGKESRVTDTRRTRKYKYRRRKCLVCNKVFSTREYYVEDCEVTKDQLKQWAKQLDRIRNSLSKELERRGE